MACCSLLPSTDMGRMRASAAISRGEVTDDWEPWVG